ncbi:hypothetical protein [Variovorax paradoxus]|uniref:Uncharacterized protein n=1 Tax=Variovorax paradoxus TaxID=34073 RepID=A0A0H2M5L3_VARPD|nr:hypothetical protein [Variovorax paradoxus]KLN57648.1 hypothetical protein VPARA_11610 [Variovorax paradoxus]
MDRTLVSLTWFAFSLAVLAGVSWFCGWKPSEITASFRAKAASRDEAKEAFEQYWEASGDGRSKLAAWAAWKSCWDKSRLPRRTSMSEVCASLSGIAGAWLLATQFHPAWGFGAFLVSNFGGIHFYLRQRHRWVLVQQVFFLGSSLIGLWNWWLWPLVQR